VGLDGCCRERAGGARRVRAARAERRRLRRDARFYHESANLLADGKGFISPFEYQRGHVVEAADHPPLYIVFLAVPSALRMTSTLTHLVWSCALGTATIVLIGLLGWAIVNERVGIIAAAVLAVFPDASMSDGSLLAETAAMFTATLAVLLAYACWRQPSWRRFAAVGAATGAAALARSELVLLVVALVVPLPFSPGTSTCGSGCAGSASRSRRSSSRGRGSATTWCGSAVPCC
jgi:4-amino-4-deoxy-L-arabinose transferase-like glycosyltransferase